ncbi:hypothetical protein CCR97_08295 [Rhodoplanes elegans]|uniref:Tail assembly chaperone n=1 Tax=Rhodoplanes elegans TaxID=29408 RepID=A0A327KXP3_9BRAD|nr:hypothetical protein [Rhodoplanes elegans]MBK5958118.1 hypothetical protein [Rhodoplanes elegans]MBK5958210.1 hypothetical protein [Rhodoplanes elegans]RAI41992.1 hypothetical protein CH338_01435 [Rhodoplanes elegans]
MEQIPDEPEPLPGAELYLSAFHDLSGDRQYGAMGGAGPIPWLALDRWAGRAGLDGDDFDRLVRMVRAVDAEWLADQAERAEAERQRQKRD